MRRARARAMTDFGLDDLDVDALRARQTMKWTLFGPTVLAGWVAEMDFPTAPVVLDALDRAIGRQQFGYPVLDRDTGLPDAFAAWSQEHHGWAVDPEHVHIIPDVLRGVALAIEHSSRIGSAVILPTPAYMPFFDLVPIVGRELIEVPLRVDGGRPGLDLDRIDAAFATGAGSIILCHPHNPVGRSFTREELEDLATVVERHEGYVIADEVHAPLTYAGRVHVPYASISPAAAAHSITITSASKAWNLPGLKCAVAVLTRPADRAVWDRFTMQTHGASTLGIAANVAAFSDGGPWLDAVLAYLDATRRWLPGLLAEHLPGVGFTPPDATYLAWLDCSSLRLPVEPADFFLAHARVAVNHGRPFGTGFDHFVRLNLATSRSILEQMVVAMGAAVTAHRGS